MLQIFILIKFICVRFIHCKIMAMSSYSRLVDFLGILFLGGLLIQNSVNISGTLVALMYSSEDCSNWLRTWLIVHSSVIFFSFCLYVFYKGLGFSVWCVWSIAWSIIGTLLVFDNSDCSGDFPTGFAGAAIMILVNYFMLCTVAGVFCICGIGTCVGHGLSSMYREIDP